MQTELQKKYGFAQPFLWWWVSSWQRRLFKAEQVLQATGAIYRGYRRLGYCGLIMIICSYAFATMATVMSG